MNGPRRPGDAERMPIDTLLVYVGVYGDVADAEADHQLVKDLHTEADLIDAYDAAVTSPGSWSSPWPTLGANVEQAMARAAKLEQRRIEADLAELERDAASVEQKIY